MYDRIVLGVDGSEAANRAANAGLAVAALFDAEVSVVTVVESGLLDRTADAAEDDRLREAARDVLDEVVADAEARGLSVSGEVLEGNPADRIADFAGDWAADLVVLGRQGHTGLGERILGSTTESVVHYSDVPVLVIPEGGTTLDADLDRVLLPTDGSENAERAVPHAGTVAERTGATVAAVSVLDVQTAAGPFGAGGLEPSFVDRLERESEAALDRVTDRLAESYPDVAVTTDLVRSTSFSGVAPVLADYVADHDVDLVVLGSHGRSNLGRQVLGSVTSKLLRTVQVPVLVVTRES